MTEEQKEHNKEVLREIISEAEAALRNMADDDIDDVQQNFICLESIVQDLRI